jgi:acylphosphatase
MMSPAAPAAPDLAGARAPPSAGLASRAPALSLHPRETRARQPKRGEISFDEAIDKLNNCAKNRTEEDGMASFAGRVVQVLASVLIWEILAEVALAANAQQEAITATVIGEKVQKVGYRALIQKQAIMYNLAGYARNNPDGTVGVALQGDEDRIAKTLEAVSAGNKKSSQANIIGESQAPFDPNLKTFTIFSWTSVSRNISNPYDLVFNLRPANDEISKKDAAAIWNAIAESTLKGEDLAKFMKHLEDDE